MNRKDYFKQYYAKNRLKLKQKRLLSLCDSGIYLLSNPHTNDVYVGASKNVCVRFQRHYSTSFHEWTSICSRDDWKVDVILHLPPLDIQTYNVFETVLCMVYAKRGYRLLNKYNYDADVEELQPLIEHCLQYVSDEIRKAMRGFLEEIVLVQNNEPKRNSCPNGDGTVSA